MKKRPNILLFFTDQQRADTCGCYGSDLGLTPSLDTLAAEGVTFKNAVTCQPVCGPARAVIQTGRYATKNGCFRNALGLKDDNRTLAHLLNRAGYTTNYIGKWHLSLTGLEPVPMEKRCGFTGEWKAADLLEFTSDAYEGYIYGRDNEKISFSGQYRSDFLTGHAARFINQYEKEEPFFLMVSYLEPHHQNTRNRYIAPEGYADRYRGAKVPEDLLQLDKPDADWRANLADYYGCIRRLDENLGEVVAALKEKGLYDDTVIIFTSDHGSHFRTRNGEYKRSCHEASIKIPMVCRGGSYLGGRVVEEALSLVDLAPTVLEIAGAGPEEQMDGRAAGCLLKDGAADWDNDVLIQISESQVARALRTPRWKYCVTAPHKNAWSDSGSDIYVEECLYDLENDPYELNNLIDRETYQEVKKELKDKLIRKLELAGEVRPKIVPLV